MRKQRCSGSSSKLKLGDRITAPGFAQIPCPFLQSPSEQQPRAQLGLLPAVENPSCLSLGTCPAGVRDEVSTLSHPAVFPSILASPTLLWLPHVEPFGYYHSMSSVCPCTSSSQQFYFLVQGLFLCFREKRSGAPSWEEALISILRVASATLSWAHCDTCSKCNLVLVPG